MSQSSTMNTNKAATIAKVPVAFQREAAQALRHKVAVYVPATVNVTEAVDNTFFVGEAEATLCLAFGGATIMALTKLIEHTKRKHGLTSEEYRKEFGLMKGACLIAPAYANKMVAHAKRCRTFDRNFLPVQQGSARGKRGHGYKWSTQEVEVRRPAQAYNSRQRWEPKKQQGV